jgi:phage FluMu protein Com
MPRRGQTTKQARREERQEDLRELLTTQGHLQHVVKICEELNDLTAPMEALDVTRKSKVIETKLKLINKYLPDLKNVEIAGDGGKELLIKLVDYTDAHSE